jgi:ABC-type transport system involved in multi-copper enzyme maturation permease subunit
MNLFAEVVFDSLRDIIFEYIHSIYFLSFYVPLLALFLGLGTVSDEIETRNITFTLTRPLSRVSIVFGRYFGHLIAALILVNVSLFGAYMSNMLFQVEDLIAKVPAMLNGAFVLSFGTACYLAVVAMFGTVLRRFAVIISLIWIIFDTLASLFFPFGLLKHLNVRYRMLASYAEMLPQALPSTVSVEPSSALLNALVCMVIAVVACSLMAVRLSFEIVLSEGAK